MCQDWSSWDQVSSLWSVSLLAWSEEHRVGIATGAAAQVQTKVIDNENDYNEETNEIFEMKEFDDIST